MEEMTEVVNGMNEIFKITSKLKVILDNTEDDSLKELYLDQVNQILNIL